MATADGGWNRLEFGFSAFLTLFVAGLIALALTFGPTSQLVPLVVGVPTLCALALATLAQVWAPATRFVALFNSSPISVDSELFGEETTRYRDRPVVTAIAWAVGLLLASYLFGFVLVIPFFVYAYLTREGGHARRQSAIIAVATTMLISALFEFVFATPLYAGAIPNALLELLLG